MNLEEIEKQQNIKFILKEQWCWDGVLKDAKKRFVVFLDKYDNYVDSTGDNWIHISDEQPVEPVYVPVKGDWGYFWNSSKK